MTSHLFFDLSGLHFLRYHLQHQDLKTEKSQKSTGFFRTENPSPGPSVEDRVLTHNTENKGEGATAGNKGEGATAGPAESGSSSGAGVGWGVPPAIPGEGQRGKINDHTKANAPKRAQSRAHFTVANSRIIDAIKSPLTCTPKTGQKGGLKVA